MKLIEGYLACLSGLLVSQCNNLNNAVQYSDINRSEEL